MNEYNITGIQTTGFIMAPGDIMTVQTGGVANFNTVNGGTMTVYGAANSTTVNDDGGIFIYGTANSTMLTYDASGFVYSGGVANTTSLGSHCNLILYSGAVASGTVLSDGGILTVGSGAVALDTCDAGIRGGEVGVNGGILSGGIHRFVSAVGGQLRDVTVSGECRAELGTYIENATIISGGDLDIYAGVVASNINLYGTSRYYFGPLDTCSLHVYNGGYVRAVHFDSGSFALEEGGSASDIVCSGDVYLDVYGKIDDIELNGGSTTIYSKAVLDTVEVNANAKMYVSSGALLTGVRENGGYIFVSSGADCNFIENTLSGLVLSSYQSATCHSATTAKDVTLEGARLDIFEGGKAHDAVLNSGGSICVYSGALAENTEVNLSGGMFISGGGAAKGTAVNSGGSVYIKSGGKASDTTCNDWCSMTVSSGGSADGTVLASGGTMTISGGGVADNTTVNVGGYMAVSSGASAILLKENGGCVTVKEGANVTFASNTVTGASLKGWNTMTVHSNTVANSTMVNSNGYLRIYSGGVANSTAVNKGGYVYLSSGGVVNNTTVNSSGWMEISSGGVANSTTVNGTVYVYGGKANNTVINKGGTLIFRSGGAVNSTTVRGALTVASAAANNTTVVDGGYISVSNAVAVNTTMNNGDVYVKDGGVINNTTVNSGELFISSGASAANTVINSGGEMYVSSSGKAENVALNAGAMIFVRSGASAFRIKENGGYVDVEAGANVTFVSNTLDGLTLSAFATVHSNTTANNTVAGAGCWLYIFSGAVANSTKVKESGGLRVSGGGVVNRTSVCSSGKMYICSDAIVKNGLDISSGAIVSAYEGAIIDFTVTERTVSDGYMINDLSLVSGAPTYTITVNADQGYGTYKLARKAQNISSTLSINTESGNIGTLTVNGDVLEYNDRKYKLTNSNGNLHLSVQDKNAAEAPVTNLLTNGVSQILAWDAEQGKVGYMATNGNVRPSWRGVWEWSGAEADLWRVAGVGHFKGSEVDYDGVLLYNGVGNRFAAWTDLRKGSYGYVNLCKVDGSFNTQCLANLDGDEYDDILIYDTNGSIGVVLGGTTYKDIFHVNEGDFATWTIEGAGSFDDGMDKLVMVNNYNHQVYLWTNQDTTFATWNWKTQSVGKLESGWEVAAVGDFEGDGIDDIMVLDRNTNNVWVWDDGNSQTKRWRGTLGEGFEIEAAGDYNGDGCADLLLREYNSGWGGMGYWGNGYAGNWTDLYARIETDLKSSFDIIA